MNANRDLRDTGVAVGAVETGVDGSSTLLANDVAWVRLGIEVKLVAVETCRVGSVIGLVPSLVLLSSLNTCTFLPELKPSKSGRLSIASSIESSEYMYTSLSDFLVLAARPTDGLGFDDDSKNRLRSSLRLPVGVSSVIPSEHNLGLL